MTLILGIDPGSRKTGFGIIHYSGRRQQYIASGIIRLPEASLPERLQIIFANICQIIDEYKPDEMAIEQVFMSKSAGSALKLGQARGAAIVAGTSMGLNVAEYEARKVKQSVVGHGAADKQQVQHMVQQLLQLSAALKEDAADALAVALCHGNSQQYLSQVTQAQRFRRGRLV
ncbi:MAG: crossover junction endodeoxyribonuclease RuvC [Cellvibrionaceae bacterium]|nr:crossover junction endodeoxyribonuclease RuvC [Cellvibrionaceae bacterium]